MIILTILILIITGFLAVGISAEWKSWIITSIITVLILLCLINAAVIAENKEKVKRATFNIIKVDSTYIYKVNETADSLIIENRHETNGTRPF